MKENILDNYTSENNNNNNLILTSKSEEERAELKSSITSNDSSFYSNFSNPRTICYIITLGEVIALLSVSSGKISNEVSGNEHRHYATVLNFIYYLSFGLFWFIFNHGFSKPKGCYFLILFFDTQTNFFKILALTKGDLSYPYIINSSSILFIALLTYIFIKKYKYTWKHFLATFLCFFGTILSFYGVLKGKSSIMGELKDNFYGFIFSIISAFFFTFTIVCIEIYFKKGKEIYNFFPYLGFFGTLIIAIESIIYFKITNKVIIKNFSIDLVHLMYALLFIIISVALGTMVPFYIKRYSCSMYNFFMVSQIFWSYIFNIIFEKENRVRFHFYIGFIIILGSIVLFSVFKLKRVEQNKSSNFQSINLISASERTTQL